MKKRKKKDYLEIGIQQGGMRQFAETGVYPEHLTIYSPKWDMKWEEDVSGRNEGELYARKDLAYTYRRVGEEWKFRDAEGHPVETIITDMTMSD